MIFIFLSNNQKEKNNNTLVKLPSIRNKYRKAVDEENFVDYLTELEFFATGVNNGVYSIKITKKMSGRVLVSEYDNKYKDYIDHVRKSQPNAYIEYEEMICKIKKRK